MNVAGLIYLLAAHYLTGRGLLTLFKLQLKPVPQFCLSMITGVPLISFAPCLVQLLHIPITAVSVAVAIGVITAAFSIAILVNFKKPEFPKIVFPKVYEWPYLILCLLLVWFSVWRCFYYPPYSRDMLSGPELIAEYAIREKTMINSIYRVDLSTSNNYFKSPYITGLQIIYKLLVSTFGQIWLSLLFVTFIVWIYNVLTERLHSLIACILLLLFICIPELFAYTFLILYDYSNMVFFFGGFYFLSRYWESDRLNEFAFSAFMFGLATYIRTETLVLVGMALPVPALFFYLKKLPMKVAAKRLATFFIVPTVFYFVCIHVFVKLFVPLRFDLSTQINPDLKNTEFFFERIHGINEKLIFSEHAVQLWGYFIFVFFAVLIMDIIWLRRFNGASRIALYGLLLVYFGLALLGYLIPHVDLENTTKRGMFKAFPLMLLYMANSGLLLRLSEIITKWEYSGTEKKA